MILGARTYLDDPLVTQNIVHVLFIRNHFISNLVLDSLRFKKLLELHVFL